MKKALLEVEDVSPTSSSTPAGSPTCVSEPPSPPPPDEEAQTPPAEAVPVKPRQRSGRQRPRPISDYGLTSRTHSIPEEVAQQHAKDRTSDALVQTDCVGGSSCEAQENCDGIDGDVRNGRHRPLSVIGGLDVYPPNAEDKDEHLSSVSF